MKSMEVTTQERQLNVIAEMTEYIMDEVSYAEIKSIDPFVCNDSEDIAVTLSFSRGTRFYDVTIDWKGSIIDFSNKIPKHMLVDIHNGICAGYLKGITDELFSKN